MRPAAPSLTNSRTKYEKKNRNALRVTGLQRTSSRGSLIDLGPQDPVEPGGGQAHPAQLRPRGLTVQEPVQDEHARRGLGEGELRPAVEDHRSLFQVQIERVPLPGSHLEDGVERA